MRDFVDVFVSFVNEEPVITFCFLYVSVLFLDALYHMRTSLRSGRTKSGIWFNPQYHIIFRRSLWTANICLIVLAILMLYIMVKPYI